jgi:hypothetical protein
MADDRVIEEACHRGEVVVKCGSRLACAWLLGLRGERPRTAEGIER